MPTPPPPPPSKPFSRRKFIRRALGATILGTGFYSFGVEPYFLEVVRRPLPLKNLPASLAGKTLAQLSDLHVGRTPMWFLQHAVATAVGLRPDVITITGDFMSCMGHEQIASVVQLLSPLPARTTPVFACLGNHDYGPAWAHPKIADALVASLDTLGIQTLRNQAINYRGLAIVGFEDLWSATRWNPTAAMRALAVIRPASGPALALCHNPDACDLPHWASAGFDGYVLAGHTHGGQCKPPFLPPPMLPVKNRLYTAGHFAIAGGGGGGGGFDLYINRATGNLRPVRFNCRPELTLFTLVRV